MTAGISRSGAADAPTTCSASSPGLCWSGRVTAGGSTSTTGITRTPATRPRPGHRPPVLTFTTEQIAARHHGLGRFIARNQAALFFPLLLEGLNLHVASVRFLASAPPGRASRYRVAELALFAVHGLAYTAALLLVLDRVKAAAFFAIRQAVFGVYMGCSFAPNHKGMPTIAPGHKIDFLCRQVLTSRNVRGGWFTDLVLGGLN
jgi:hypothetical protein